MNTIFALVVASHTILTALNKIQTQIPQTLLCSQLVPTVITVPATEQA